MKQTRRSFVYAVATLVVVGCSEPEESPDAGSALDAGRRDGGGADSGGSATNSHARAATDGGAERAPDAMGDAALDDAGRPNASPIVSAEGSPWVSLDSDSTMFSQYICVH